YPLDHYAGLEKARWLEGRRAELKKFRVATLVQLLEPEDAPVRLCLVDVLAAVPGRAATEALAGRAVFDPAPLVREAAARALADRAAPASRPPLPAALRPPWPPAAEHAAEALVALGDRGALDTLVDLLDRPDPAAAFKGPGGKVVRRELVAVNHLANCLLCHAPSA